MNPFNSLYVKKGDFYVTLLRALFVNSYEKSARQCFGDFFKHSKKQLVNALTDRGVPGLEAWLLLRECRIEATEKEIIRVTMIVITAGIQYYLYCHQKCTLCTNNSVKNNDLTPFQNKKITRAKILTVLAKSELGEKN